MKMWVCFFLVFFLGGGGGGGGCLLSVILKIGKLVLAHSLMYIPSHRIHQGNQVSSYLLISEIHPAEDQGGR